MVPAAKLVDAVSRVSGVPTDKIMNRCRERPVVRCRQGIVYVLHHKRGLSVGVIARSLNYERSSVRYSLDQFAADLRARDPVAQRSYRTAIRCYVKLKQAQQRFNEGVTL